MTRPIEDDADIPAGAEMSAVAHAPSRHGAPTPADDSGGGALAPPLLPGSSMEGLMSEIAGRVVLITGGNAGIGRATAIEFAKQRAKVVVSGRREKEGEEVVAGIKASGGEAIFVRADVSNERDTTSG